MQQARERNVFLYRREKRGLHDSQKLFTAIRDDLAKHQGVPTSAHKEERGTNKLTMGNTRKGRSQASRDTNREVG